MGVPDEKELSPMLGGDMTPIQSGNEPSLGADALLKNALDIVQDKQWTNQERANAHSIIHEQLINRRLLGDAERFEPQIILDYIQRPAESDQISKDLDLRPRLVNALPLLIGFEASHEFLFSELLKKKRLERSALRGISHLTEADDFDIENKLHIQSINEIVDFIGQEMTTRINEIDFRNGATEVLIGLDCESAVELIRETLTSYVSDFPSGLGSRLDQIHVDETYIHTFLQYLFDKGPVNNALVIQTIRESFSRGRTIPIFERSMMILAQFAENVSDVEKVTEYSLQVISDYGLNHLSDEEKIDIHECLLCSLLRLGDRIHKDKLSLPTGELVHVAKFLLYRYSVIFAREFESIRLPEDLQESQFANEVINSDYNSIKYPYYFWPGRLHR